jgi:hypothetical protein
VVVFQKSDVIIVADVLANLLDPGGNLLINCFAPLLDTDNQVVGRQEYRMVIVIQLLHRISLSLIHG